MNDEVKEELKQIISNMRTMEHHLSESDNEGLKKLGEYIERWYQTLENLVDTEYREEDSITQTIEAILKDLTPVA